MRYNKQPLQRLSYRKKTKEWRKENVDVADKFSFIIMNL